VSGQIHALAVLLPGIHWTGEKSRRNLKLAASVGGYWNPRIWSRCFSLTKLGTACSFTSW